MRNTKVRVHDKRSKWGYSRRVPTQALSGLDGMPLPWYNFFPLDDGGHAKLKAVNLQYSAYPPKAMIYLADPAAIKVRSLYFYLVHTLDVGS